MPMVNMFTGLSISATGLRAQRVKQNVISANLANAETTRTAEGGPYKKQTVVFKADPQEFEPRFEFGPDRLKGTSTQPDHMKIPASKMMVSREYIGSGVQVAEISKSDSQRLVFNPEHPDANTDGYVAMPDINVVQEMTDMIIASRSYEANATAFESNKQMLMKALEL